MRIDATVVRFPDVKLAAREAPKLRGFFGTFFRDRSPLLHNHFEDGATRYAYPLVQYKVIDGTPHLVGALEGARLLFELFVSMREIEIEGTRVPLRSKNILHWKPEIGTADRLMRYRFATPWMALNGKNYLDYAKAKSEGERRRLLSAVLVGNVLSMYKHLGLRVEERLFADTTVRPRQTKFKNRNMTTFVGEFSINALIPELFGVGKSASRGFGSARLTEEREHIPEPIR
ncbi:MAG: DNA repair protein [Ignavibacteriales bacterium]|nr:DNA repair protein [Ignavibacteriales bacterium]